MANSYVAETLSDAAFLDTATGARSTLNGSWIAEYDPSGALVSVFNPSFSLLAAGGETIRWSSAVVSGAQALRGTYGSDPSAFSRLAIDYAGANAATLTGGAVPGSSSSVFNAATGRTDFLADAGVVTAVPVRAVSTQINGAVFADGSTLSGSWTAIYDGAGTLQAVENARFVVTGTSGATTVFTAGGTLPYAQSAAGSTYEIHFTGVTGSSAFSSLYVDWKGETPAALSAGTASLYTSVIHDGSAPIRLLSGGTSVPNGASSPVISGLPTTLAGLDRLAVQPLAGVLVCDADPTALLGATVTVTVNGVASDANGTLSGAGLVRTGAGTYTLAASTPSQLTQALGALVFTPTQAEGPPGAVFGTTIGLAVSGAGGSASAGVLLSETATCFLPGTLIDTPFGGVPIESLRPGDLVTVMENGLCRAQPVRWIGQGRMDAGRASDPAAAFPVRIRRHAFDRDVPARDLLLTPEHCVFVENRLVPVRMLVNGASILSDLSLPRYDFLHLELDRHGILLAEGMEVESYLDTGNRATFSANVLPLDPHFTVDPDQASWQEDAAAPLCVDRAVVEPIWRALDRRARTLGLDTPEGVALVTEPELHLLTSDGFRIEPCLCDGSFYAFVVPPGVDRLRLVSRSFRPSETTGPFFDDRRSLGVCVGRIGVTVDRQRVLSTTHLLDRPLPGWHAMEENEAGRWTCGDAWLPVPINGEAMFLDIEVLAGGPYLARRAA